MISADKIESRIFQIRGKNILLGMDLARLYNVDTRTLNQAVKRNLKRFPGDFMFYLSKEEISRISQTVTSLKFHKSVSAFTEQGVAMLSGVLNSERAIFVNIQIMRAFVNLRRVALTYVGLKRKIDAIEKKYDSQFAMVFDAIRQLMAPPEPPPEPERRITGFHT